MKKQSKWKMPIIGAMITVLCSVTSVASVQAAEQAAAVTNRQESGNINGLLAAGVLALLFSAGGGHHTETAAQTASATTGTAGTVQKPAATTTASTSAQSTNGTASEVQTALNLVNADRKAQGLQALTFNSSLAKVADTYAKTMIERGFFSHYTPEGQSPFDRMKAAGIAYTYAGENLAINNSVQAAEKAFMNSAGHRANILNTNYTQIGIGVRHAANGSTYVVQEFIKP